ISGVVGDSHIPLSATLMGPTISRALDWSPSRRSNWTGRYGSMSRCYGTCSLASTDTLSESCVGNEVRCVEMVKEGRSNGRPMQSHDYREPWRRPGDALHARWASVRDLQRGVQSNLHHPGGRASRGD